MKAFFMADIIFWYNVLVLALRVSNKIHSFSTTPAILTLE